MKVTRDKNILRTTSVKVDDGLVPHRVVLRHVPESVMPWVTHEEAMKIVDDGETMVHHSFYWGNYFDSKEAAEADFEKRASKFR